jgi:precorrin-6Y C5,15-methyltransferase (decarboxylating)
VTDRIAVLGVHAGRVAPEGQRLLDEARVVAGGRAVLDALAPDHARRIVLGADLAAAIEDLATTEGPACVLASGDPGLFGIVRALGARVGRERLEVHPAPSSVAVAFARLGLPWDDAHVVTAHARDPAPALHVALRHPKVAILTGPQATPEWFAERLAGSGRTMVVAERLGLDGERLRSGTPEELACERFAEPNVLVVLDPAHEGVARGSWALDEQAFAHRAGMITKAEVRALALARLGPGVGDLVWDVGCGSGSVAVESARLGAAAIAIDHDPVAIELCTANARTFGVPVRTITGHAPGALEELPDPDAAFVGGGGAELGAILDACGARARRAVVVTLAIVERAGPALDRLAAAGLEAEASLVQASRLRPIAGGHRLAAENPVVVASGVRG